MLCLRSPPSGLVPDPYRDLGLADGLPTVPVWESEPCQAGDGDLLPLCVPSSLFWLCCPRQVSRPANPAPPAAGWPPSRQPMDSDSQTDHTCHSRWFKIPKSRQTSTWSLTSQANVSLAQELGLSLAVTAVRDHSQVGKQIASGILGC